MNRTRILFLTMAVGSLVLAGCAAPGEARDPWPGAPTAQLQPTGMTLIGAPATGMSQPRAVVDGAGDLWRLDPWQLTRIDPGFGHDTSWNAEDDEAFATVSSIEPSMGAGVWVLGPTSAKLFAGQSFVADLVVPEEYYVQDGVTYDPNWISDVAEQGDAVWVVVEMTGPETPEGTRPFVHRVLRWQAGRWEAMSGIVDGFTGNLATDSGLWSGASTASGAEQPGVALWDGTSWSSPASSDPDFPKGTGKVEPDPAGGVWVVSFVEGAGATLSHFDGTEWQTISADLSEQMGDCYSLGPAVTQDRIWLVNSTEAIGFDRHGSTQSVPLGDELVTPPGEFPALASDGTALLAIDQAGVVRLSAGGNERVWSDQLWSPGRAGAALAVSADEVWVQTARSTGAGAGSTQPPMGWSRFMNGAWEPVGPEIAQPYYAALATDGAVWMATDSGLIRFHRGQEQVMADDISEGATVAGPEGSVWVVADGDVVNVGADGTRTGIGHPDGAGSGSLCLAAAGPDGSVWVDTGCGNAVPALARWDGATWTAIQAPENAWLMEMAVTDDGTTWAAFTGDGPEDPASGIARLDQGSWVTYPGWPVSGLSAAPGGRVCALSDPDHPSISCFDRTEEFLTIPVDQSVQDVLVAPDGAMWVVGSQVARLPQVVPAA